MLHDVRLRAFGLPTPAFVAVSLGISTVVVGALAAAAWAAGFGPEWFAAILPVGVGQVGLDLGARRRSRLFNTPEAG